ncbi:MAG: hypothetical protein JNL38_27750 [Myxococcales bacterium]|nr:hypothetical protein [Myxococcales bacterium]
MYALCALLVGIACVAASMRRLWFAAGPSELDAAELGKHLGVKQALDPSRARARLAAVRALARRLPETAWERQIVEAMDERRHEVRTALVNEQLREVDWTLGKWARVPRVCASIASSAGLLLATFVLRAGLHDPEALSGDVAELVTTGIVGQALGVATLGIASTLLCVGLMSQANRIAKERLAATDALVEHLEVLADAAPAPEDPHRRLPDEPAAV